MAAGSRIPSLAAWLIVIAHFIEALLGLYIAGNTVVACCRMAGFYILRNTYRPLQAQTIAEFWNRYYYYFKELLVEFFFFPTYMRYFKKYRRVRMLAATISAATLGNMAYHFFRDFYYVADLGIFAALSGFQVYAFYSLLLGIGIGASQLRAHRSDSLRSASPIRRAISCVIVVTFFCLLEVFDYESRSHTLASHLVFFTALFSFHA
jgi:D-alanyl-lipoteichoic acid acyltransferase DltB (MBOAT superfamily)